MSSQHSQTVYLLPVESLLPAIDLLDEDKPIVDGNDGIHIRVEWDGDDAHSGTFQVRCHSSWMALQHIRASTTVAHPNQILVPSTQSVTRVCVSRGPLHSGIRFAAKLVPIRWMVNVPVEDHDLLVRRGQEYTYANGCSVDSEPWIPSSVDQQSGIQCVNLDGLVVGQDYEFWVRLWHPDGSDVYKDQDPVVRTKGSGSPVPNAVVSNVE